MIKIARFLGILKDKNDPSTLIPEISLDELSSLRENGIISGGMIPKVECIVNALKGGVKKAVIIDGRLPHSILIEIFSDEGFGTLFKRA